MMEETFPQMRQNNGNNHNSINNKGNTREDISETNDNNEIFGDSTDTKHDDHLRILFTNINGIPESASHYKNEKIYQAIEHNRVDILGMVEINKCWYKMNNKDRWHKRTFGWWESSKSTIGYNTKDSSSSAFQPGGVLLTSINKPAHRITETGQDSSGLGRWVWQKLKGKREMALRIICAYRPCKPSTAGPNTAFSQQQRYMDTKKDTRCPRTAILEDLGKEIKQWLTEGDQIILMMDCNESTTSTSMRRWTESLGIKEIFLQKHQINSIPPTYNRGTKAIDGIFVSPALEPVKSGYLAFGEFPTDHRGIFGDFSYNNAFGYTMPNIVRHPARRLKSNNPIVRKKWSKLYQTYIEKNKLDVKLYKLEQEAQNPLSPQQKLLYNSILQQRQDGIRYADKRCRKLNMGNVPFSDKLKEAGIKIELWNAVITKKSGAKYSMSKLRQLEKRNNLSHTLHTSTETAKLKLQEAIEGYHKVKDNAREIRKHFMTEQIEAISEDSGKCQSTIRKEIYHREQQKESARNIKYALKKTIRRKRYENRSGKRKWHDRYNNKKRGDRERMHDRK